jgi:SAM-dependent methyltransferase
MNAMKGFVPTPPAVVDLMVEMLFAERAPKPTDSVLDPGCGTGEFIDGILRWCRERAIALPQITGVEADSRHLPVLASKFAHVRSVRIEHADFLEPSFSQFDFIVGNPPYVSILGLSSEEKSTFRQRFETARGRFDLYLLFTEQALRRLRKSGRLVFITPEKFLYVETARPLRRLMAAMHVEEVRLIGEDTFPGLVTYPTITVVNNREPSTTEIVDRDGRATALLPPRRGGRWWPTLVDDGVPGTGPTLADLCVRISCGVATGADSIFVRRLDQLPIELKRFAYPTVSGRELRSPGSELPRSRVMLIPYDIDSRLMRRESLGELGEFLGEANVKRRLEARTCASRKPWYAFHETPPLREILRPKILCKDIGSAPAFWMDRTGEFVPRHSVYYVVPRDPRSLDAIASYLRSPIAQKWLRENCQRAAKGFIRLQSRTLQGLPIPESLAASFGATRNVKAEQGELTLGGIR